MSAVVDRIRAKITRAKQHIQDFQLGVREFHKTKPYAIGIKEDQQAGKRTYYVAKADCLPDSLTAIAADVIQNLRAPLDHIAYQLVLDARKGAKPDWLVYYPISGSATDYPATRNGKIKGVRQEVIDAIDATEPYKGGKGHALWQLNELNKPDKHELLVGAGAFFAGMDISPVIKLGMRKFYRELGHSEEGIAKTEAQLPPLLLRPADKLLALKVGDELYIEPLDNEVAKDARFTFSISFNAPGIIEPESALKTMQDLANLVDDIVGRLAKLLS